MFEELATMGASLLALLLLATLWEMVWKGIGLWKAAKNGHKIWYILILVLNTVGILPIIYILLHPKKKKK